MYTNYNLKQHDINFIDNLPYQLGTTFDENNLGLELRKDYGVRQFYSSYRYSEVFLFGNFFESVCYLWFEKGILSGIEYRFANKYLEYFRDSINNDLPEGYKLISNLLKKGNPPTASIDNIIIKLVDLTEEFFLLTVSIEPKVLNSLP